MDLRFFYKLGATRLSRRPLCGGVKEQAFFGTYGAVPLMRPEHVAQARLIILWGNNVTVSQLHLVPIINEARKHGAKLVVVDPRRIQIARQADLHLALRPGTDVVLAWALARSARLDASLAVRYACLGHDLGKATTPAEVLPKHIRHVERSVALVRALSERLRVDNACRSLA